MSLTAAALRRIAVVVQAAAVGGLAAALAAGADWSWPAALLASIAGALVAFGIGVAIAFLVTRAGLAIPDSARPQRPDDIPAPGPLSWRHAMSCYLAECRAILRMFDWLQPFRSRLTFAQPTDPLPDTPTVLLVHGYGCNHAVWLDLAPALAGAGYRCEGIDLTPVLGDIDDYAAALLARMRDLRARTGHPPLLVCHSMGGLAARAAQVMADAAGESVPCAGIVTLGSPHRGCPLATFGAGTNARQMRWASPWLTNLAEAESPAMRGRMISVFSWHDSIAGPADTSWLEGARHIPLSGIGHVSLLRDPRAVQATLDGLATLRKQPAATSDSALSLPHGNASARFM